MTTEVLSNVFGVYVDRDSVVGIITRQGGRSRDRNPVEAKFSVPVQTVPGAHPASSTIQRVPACFLGWEGGRDLALITHPT